MGGQASKLNLYIYIYIYRSSIVPLSFPWSSSCITFGIYLAPMKCILREDFTIGGNTRKNQMYLRPTVVETPAKIQLGLKGTKGNHPLSGD